MNRNHEIKKLSINERAGLKVGGGGNRLEFGSAVKSSKSLVSCSQWRPLSPFPPIRTFSREGERKTVLTATPY